MMKRAIAIYFLVIFLIQGAGSAFIVTHYMVFTDYITEKFCENKAKPELSCNGKCHLKKQLKEQSEQDTQPKKRSNTEIEIILFAPEYSDIEMPQIDVESGAIACSVSEFISEAFVLPVFHPPALSQIQDIVLIG